MLDAQPIKTILILAANPKGTAPLRLDEEVREIKAGFQRSRQRERFVVEYVTAVRPREVRRAMLDYKPQLVHFCGHGEGVEGLVLEDELGRSQLVSTEALATLFDLFSDQVECVLLNACYSEAQAKAIAQHVPSVIGMNQPISDRAAIEFATSFYDALGAGESVDFAFRLGCNAMQLQGIAEERTPVLISRGESSLIPVEPEPSRQSSETRSRIFISYKRDVQPDEPIALAIQAALGQQYSVFIDQSMLVGTKWVEQIEAEIRQADALIVLLSEQSVNSEMVEQEIRSAHEWGQEQGHPRILPVRLDYRQPFQYPLSQYLDPIHWAFWQGEADTPRLMVELERAIAGNSLSITEPQEKQALLQVRSLEAIPRPYPMAQPPMLDQMLAQGIDRSEPLVLDQPEGTMNPESRFYVERPADGIARAVVQGQGGVMVIKAPRQMGKSSLLVRTIAAARQVGKQSVLLDFQLLDKAALADADLFYRRFCAWISGKLRLPDRTAEYWQQYQSQGNPLCCTYYVEDCLLPQCDRPLVMAMDEVESMFVTPFRSEFFGMLRSWYNQRATEPLWRKLDLVLVTSTEPYLWIENLEQSPFNVAQEIELADFTTEQVALLNERHGDVLTRSQERQLMELLHGHPYLVRRALYLIASGRMTAAELLEMAIEEQGAFGDHLRYYLFRLNSKPELATGFLQVLRGQACSDEISFRLQSAGLVRREGRSVVPRCRLYGAYFQEHLR